MLKNNNFQLTQEKINLNNEKKNKEKQIIKLNRDINTQNDQITILRTENKKYLKIIDQNKKVINAVKKNLPFELR